MEPTFITPATLDDVQEYTCSKCDKSTFSVILGDDEDDPKYCSYCGAKVSENLWE
jgi:DNA-directed RNA polymerase subunit RPC12/RpoP